MQPLLRALRAALPLALFAFWLLPSVRPAAAAPAIRAAHASAQSVGLRATTPVTPTWNVGAELELPDHRPPAPAAILPRSIHRTQPGAQWLDPTTLTRSRAPIYRVRRSGQAHRSAP